MYPSRKFPTKQYIIMLLIYTVIRPHTSEYNIYDNSRNQHLFLWFLQEYNLNICERNKTLQNPNSKLGLCKTTDGTVKDIKILFQEFINLRKSLNFKI